MVSAAGTRVLSQACSLSSPATGLFAPRDDFFRSDRAFQAGIDEIPIGPTLACRSGVLSWFARALDATLRVLSRWNGPAWDAYAKWESRPFHNGDGI